MTLNEDIKQELIWFERKIANKNYKKLNSSVKEEKEISQKIYVST